MRNISSFIITEEKKHWNVTKELQTSVQLIFTLFKITFFTFVFKKTL